MVERTHGEHDAKFSQLYTRESGGDASEFDPARGRTRRSRAGTQREHRTNDHGPPKPYVEALGTPEVWPSRVCLCRKSRALPWRYQRCLQSLPAGLCYGVGRLLRRGRHFVISLRLYMLTYSRRTRHRRLYAREPTTSREYPKFSTMNAFFCLSTKPRFENTKQTLRTKLNLRLTSS